MVAIKSRWIETIERQGEEHHSGRYHPRLGFLFVCLFVCLFVVSFHVRVEQCGCVVFFGPFTTAASDTHTLSLSLSLLNASPHCCCCRGRIRIETGQEN